KVTAAASDFPNPIVRLIPDLLQMLDQRQLLRPRLLDSSKTTLSCLVNGVHELAVHVELELNGSGVADAHRRRALITGQPRHLPFGELPFTGQAVHDLELVRAS